MLPYGFNRAVSLLALVILTRVCSASVHYDLNTPGLLASMQQEELSLQLVDRLADVARYKQPTIDRAHVISRVLLDHLLADYALKHFSAADLDPGQRVAFPHDITIENEVMSTLRVAYRKPLADAVQALPQHRLISCVVKTHNLSPQQQAVIFVKPDHLMMGYDLTAAGEQLAKQVPLLDYRFPGGALAHITLYDVYIRENVQGRMSLFQNDTNYLKHQALELLSIRFVQDWVKIHSGMTAMDLKVLQMALEDKSRADALRGIMGMLPDLDEGSSYLANLASHITNADIHSYYVAHRNQFQRINQVHAMHIRVNSQKLADALVARLAHGADFAALAKANSTAADAAAGGDLGWLQHDESGHADWLTQVALTQSPGAEIRPILAPGDPTHPVWELVKVVARQDGFQQEDGPSVHFEVAQILAKREGQAAFQTLVKQLVQQADIHVDPSLQAEGLSW
ncbi:MAG: hypothetical protein HKM02_10900 [Pseudomonadales bacterium]|nr:hypothetical protein [Pseudomonadales bacterium]